MNSYKITSLNSIITAIFLCLTCACTPQKHLLNIKDTVHVLSDTQIENGNSTITIIPHKKAVLKKDSFGIGYVKLEESEGNLVKFEYKKSGLQNISDAHYSEIIYIHVPKNFSEIKSNTTTFKQAKILFGRLCYCKGQAGYYSVEKGTFTAKMESKNKLNFALNFSIKQVPHLISRLQESIDLK